MTIRKSLEFATSYSSYEREFASALLLLSDGVSQSFVCPLLSTLRLHTQSNKPGVSADYVYLIRSNMHLLESSTTQPPESRRRC